MIALKSGLWPLFLFYGLTIFVFVVIEASKSFIMRSTNFTNCQIDPGEIIQFKTLGKELKIGLEWDFGDGSPIKNMGSSAGHLYTKLGRYQVIVKKIQQLYGIFNFSF